MSKTIAVIGALDTKGSEFAFVRREIERRGHRTLVIDSGVISEPGFEPDISAAEVAEAGGSGLAELRAQGDRGTAIGVMARGGGRDRTRAACRGPDRRRAEHGRQCGHGGGHGGHAGVAGGGAEGDGEHGGVGRHQRLRGHQGRGDGALDRGRGGREPDQRAHLRQRGGRGGGDGGNGRAGDRGQAADRGLDVRQHDAGGGALPRAAGRAWATRCWSFTPPAPAVARWKT